jgi:hypothetical protein
MSSIEKLYEAKLGGYADDAPGIIVGGAEYSCDSAQYAVTLKTLLFDEYLRGERSIPRAVSMYYQLYPRAPRCTKDLYRQMCLELPTRALAAAQLQELMAAIRMAIQRVVIRLVTKNITPRSVETLPKMCGCPDKFQCQLSAAIKFLQALMTEDGDATTLPPIRECRIPEVDGVELPDIRAARTPLEADDITRKVLSAELELSKKLAEYEQCLCGLMRDCAAVIAAAHNI